MRRNARRAVFFLLERSISERLGTGRAVARFAKCTHSGNARFFLKPPRRRLAHKSPHLRDDRLLFGIFSEDGDAFLGSGVSGPIRVLANNDVPKGAACLRIRCSLAGARVPQSSGFPSLDPSPDPGTSPGIPRTSRGRARAFRAVPNDTPHRPRPPPGAPWRAPGCLDERRVRVARDAGALTPILPSARALPNPQPTGRAGSPPSHSTRTARRFPPPPRTPRTGVRRTAAAALPSPRGASAP